MINWTSLKRNKYFKILIFLTILSMILGLIFFFKIENNISVDKFDLKNVLKNNFSYHIIFFSLIFFFSFLFIGYLLGMIIYSFEIMNFTILTIFLIINFNIKGLIITVLVLIYRMFYFILIALCSLSCFKISRSLLSKQKYEKEKLVNHIKIAIIFSLIGILVEIFNYTIGYKLIMFLTNLL